MENLRENIKQLLDVPVDQGHFAELQDCIWFKPENLTGIQCLEIDSWFRGVIHSLYYRPNPKVLVLVNPEPIGKTEFFKRLLPDKLSDMYCQVSPIDDTSVLFSGIAYEHIIADLEFHNNILNLPMLHNFRLNKGYAEKRLVSYCSSTNNWPFPQRNKYIVLKLDSIDQERFNAIDKLSLWREIFNLYKL